MNEIKHAVLEAAQLDAVGDGDAAELFSMAQLAPGEGIEDAVRRIEEYLAARQPVGVKPVGYWFTDDPAKFAMPGSGFHPGAKPPVDAINVVPVYPPAPAAVAPSGWQLRKQATCYQLSCGNNIIGNFVGPDAEQNAAKVVQMLSAPAAVPVAEIIEDLAGDVESCVSDACGYLSSDNGWRDYGIYRDDAEKRYQALPNRIRALATHPQPAADKESES